MTETQIVHFYDDLDEDGVDEAYGMEDEEEAVNRVPFARMIWKGEEFDLYKGDNLIGRDEVCEVVLDHKSISAKHAEIIINDEVIIRDLRSANGTFVESPIGSGHFQRLSITHNRRVLSDGIKVRFGMVCCEFVLLSNKGNHSNQFAETLMLPGVGGFGLGEQRVMMETQLLPDLNLGPESSMSSYHTAIGLPLEIAFDTKNFASSTDFPGGIVASKDTSAVHMTSISACYPPEVATMVDNATQLFHAEIQQEPPINLPQQLQAVPITSDTSLFTAVSNTANTAGIRAVRATERIVVSAAYQGGTQSHSSEVPTQVDMELLRNSLLQQSKDEDGESDGEEENGNINNVNALDTNQSSLPNGLEHKESDMDDDIEVESQDIMQVDDEEEDNEGEGWMTSKNSEHIPSANNTNLGNLGQISIHLPPPRTLMDVDTDDESDECPILKQHISASHTQHSVLSTEKSTALEEDNTYITTAANSAQESPVKATLERYLSPNRHEATGGVSTAVPTPDIDAVGSPLVPILDPKETEDKNEGNFDTANHSRDEKGCEAPSETILFADTLPSVSDSSSSTSTRSKRNQSKNSSARKFSPASVSSPEGLTFTGKRKLSKIVEEEATSIDEKGGLEALPTVELHSEQPKVELPAAKKSRLITRKTTVSSESVLDSSSAVPKETNTSSTRNRGKRPTLTSSDSSGEDVNNNLEESVLPIVTDESDGAKNPSVVSSRSRSGRVLQNSENISVETGAAVSQMINKSRGSIKKSVESTAESNIAKQSSPIESTDVEQKQESGIYLMFTKLEESAYQRYLRRLPQVSVTSDARLATHIVTTTELKRTPKLLVALNSRVRFILTDCWLIESAKQQAPIDLLPSASWKTLENTSADTAEAYCEALQHCPYLVQDREKEQLWQFQLAETLTRIRFVPAEKRAIFQNVAFFVTEGIFGTLAPSNVEMRSIIDSAGGVLCDDLAKFWRAQEQPLLQNSTSISTAAGALEEPVPLISKRQRRMTESKSTSTVREKQHRQELVDTGLLAQLRSRCMVVISHATVAKEQLPRDILQRLRRCAQNDAPRVCAPGIYSIELLFQAVLRQELNLEMHKLDGYDFSR